MAELKPKISADEERFWGYVIARAQEQLQRKPDPKLAEKLRVVENTLRELRGGPPAQAVNEDREKKATPARPAPSQEEEKMPTIMERGKKRVKDSDKERMEIHLANITRVGETMVIPETLTYDEAIGILKRQRDYEEEVTAVHAEIECFLFEGAWAFHKACSDLFGWVRHIPTPGFFGDDPPMMLGVPISRTETVQVPWGRIQLPVIEGFLQTGTMKKEGRFIFTIMGEVKRRYEGTVNHLIEETKRLVREESIYRGKAFRIHFRDAEGEALPVPQPEFLNLEHAPTPGDLIFKQSVMRQIEANLFTMVTRTDDVRAAGVPLKRGVLLSGKYGTGKTLCAAAMARLAEEHGWTFIECERADEIGQVLRLAQFYGRSVVFCEDIDRVMRGQRSIEVDAILNIIDGVEAKSTEVLIVLSTNDVSAIQKAMIRPGRIDAVINMEAPDAEAVERLIRMYGRGLIAASEPLARVSQRLEGQIPSMVRDVVEAAKLFQIPHSQPGETLAITEEALLDAAVSKEMQIELLQEPKVDNRDPIEKAADTLAGAIKVSGNGHDNKVLTGTMGGMVASVVANGDA